VELLFPDAVLKLIRIQECDWPSRGPYLSKCGNVLFQLVQSGTTDVIQPALLLLDEPSNHSPYRALSTTIDPTLR